MHGFNLSVLTDKWTGREAAPQRDLLFSPERMSDGQRAPRREKKTEMEGEAERNLQYEFTVVMLLAVKQKTKGEEGGRQT